MWLRRLITFGAIALALIATVWAELEYHPTIGSGHQQEQHGPNQISGPSEVAIFLLECFRSTVDWTEAHHDFIIAVGTVLLAIFTLALFVATYGLLTAARTQGSDMQNLLTAARDNVTAADGLRVAAEAQERALRTQADATVILAAAAAKSANIAEKALVELEAPFLYTKITHPGIKVTLTAGTRDQVMHDAVPPEGAPPSRHRRTEWTDFHFVFGNYGRTPAQITAYYRDIFVMPDLITPPSPIEFTAVPAGEVIELPPGIFVMGNGGESQPLDYPLMVRVMGDGGPVAQASPHFIQPRTYH
jgi:hypothetical protein